jgi:tRNA-modifying protein YgfZ
MSTAENPAEQIEIAHLHFSGPDALKFLQGQLSNDMADLGVDGTLLAGLHNPQGRVIALLELTRPSDEEIVAALPAELADAVVERLRRFVLRAKVAITSAPWSTIPPGTLTRAARIAAGLPQVYRATSEQFVAQMLNLDLIGAVSFSKGCYTGQEVIARSHYRGRVKRRMQRFASTQPCLIAPGETYKMTDGRSVQIVDAVTLADGRAEFLAVTQVVAIGAEAAPPVAASSKAAGLDCLSLPLPYALPG